MLRKIAIVVALIAIAGVVLLIRHRPARPPQWEAPSPEVAPEPAQAPSDEAEETGVGWVFTKRDPVTNEVLYEIKGAEVAHEGEQRIQIVKPVIEVFNLPGRQIKITAEKGFIGGTEGAEAQGWLKGKVRIVATDEEGVETSAELEELLWDGSQKRLSSSGPVRLAYERLAIEGTGLDSSQALDVLTLQEDVTVRLLPESAPGGGSPEAEAGKRRTSETTATCAGPLTFDRADLQATLEDQVVLKLEDLELHADKLVIAFDEEAGTLKPRLLTASSLPEGAVEIVGKTRSARAQTVVLDPAAGLFSLTGEPATITIEKMMLEGPVIELMGEDGQMRLRLRGGKSTVTWEEGGISGEAISWDESTSTLAVKGAGEFGGKVSGYLPPLGEKQNVAAGDATVHWSSAMSLSQATGQMRFAGDVVLNQGEIKLLAQDLQVCTKRVGDKPTGFEATGAAELHLSGLVLKGEQLGYDQESGKLSLVGSGQKQAEVIAGADYLRAERLRIETKTGTIVGEGKGELVVHLPDTGKEGGLSGEVTVAWDEKMSLSVPEDPEKGASVFVFSGNVVSSWQTGQLACSELRLNLASGRSLLTGGKLFVGEVTHLAATKEVAFVETGPPARKVQCDRLEWGSAATIDSSHPLPWKQDAVLLKCAGSPARISQEGFSIESGIITIDLINNRMEGQGEGTLVTEVKRPPALDGLDLAERLPVRIRWRDKAHFDGKQNRVTLWDHVILSAGELELHATEKLEIFLTSEGKLDKGFAYGGEAGGGGLGIQLNVGENLCAGSSAQFDLAAESFVVLGRPGLPATLMTAQAKIEAHSFHYQRFVRGRENVFTAEGMTSGLYSGSVRVSEDTAEKLSPVR